MEAAAFRFVPAGLLVFALASALPRPAAAAWPTDPLANVPLCSAVDVQELPVTIPDGAGGAIVAWWDGRAGVNIGIYAQRIAADGTLQWASDGVAVCLAAGDKGAPVLVSDGAGGAIVAWNDNRRYPATNDVSDIYAQRISAAGSPMWTADGVALCTAAGGQVYPAIAPDGAGGAVVAWSDERDTSYAFVTTDIYAQRISAGGVVQWPVNGVALCSVAGDQQYPSVVTDGASGAIVTWVDYRPGHYYDTPSDIYSQRVSAAGSPMWTANGVELCTALNSQDQVTSVPDDAGGAIALWQDSRTGPNADLYAQRISGAGAVEWTGNGVSACLSGLPKWEPAIASDGAGGIVATWRENRLGTSNDIYAARISSAGARLWSDNGVGVCLYSNDQRYSTIVGDGTGGAIVTWQDLRNGVDYDVYAMRVSADGTAQWTAGGSPISTATRDQSQPTLAPDGAGGAFIAWMDSRNDAVTSTDIYAQRVWSNGSTPVLLSLVSSEVGGDGVHLTWFASGSAGAVATVYRTYGDGEWTRIGEVTADGTGYLRYTDPLAGTAVRAGYRLGTVDAKGESFSGETWVDLPALAFALDPVRPNPSRHGWLSVNFTLPGGAAASLELLDVSGRRIAVRAVGSLGAGRHALNLAEGRKVSQGIYLVRLTQGSAVRVARVAVLD